MQLRSQRVLRAPGEDGDERGLEMEGDRVAAIEVCLECLRAELAAGCEMESSGLGRSRALGLSEAGLAMRCVG